MAWDKSKPVTNSDLLSAEIRANWDALDVLLVVPVTALANGQVLYKAAGPVLAGVPASTNGYVLTLVGGVPLWQPVSVPAIAFPLLAPDGSFAAPSYSFAGATGVGLYREAGGLAAFANALQIVGSSGYLLFDQPSDPVIRVSANKVMKFEQEGMGLTGLLFNWGTLHTHYNVVIGSETYPDTGLGMLALSDPVTPPTTTAPDLVLLYGTDVEGAGTKGLLVRTEDGFIHRIGKGHQFPAVATAPGTPAAGFVVVYGKSADKKFYLKDDAGLETILTHPMTTAGDLIVGGASGVPARLADVATGSVLASGGVGVAPAWSTAPTLASLTLTARLIQARVTVTYSASMTFDAALATQFIITATNATAFTINAPSNPVLGQEIFVRIRNTSGGALGAATWNAVFKLATWTQPANGFSRTIHFAYDGSNWVEAARTPADVAN